MEHPRLNRRRPLLGPASEPARRADHDVPLEPVVLNAQRLHYKEISKSEYATLKATIEALPN